MSNYSTGSIIAQGSYYDVTYYSTTSGANTIEYICESSQPWASITTKVWRVRKVITVTATGKLEQGKSVLWADGSADFDKLATDLATVAAYTYS